MPLTRPPLSFLNSNSTVFTDPLLVLHQGSQASDSDVGFVFNRANGLVANVAIYWSEADSTFYTAYTNSGGATDANLVPTSYASLTTGTLNANNAVVTGNLTVSGTTTTINTTNSTISDSLIELNSGAGSNANDLGFIFERGSTGDNAIIAWDESADAFVMGTTTATGTSTGDLTIANGELRLDTLRIDQSGTGLRMTNVGAFDNDGSDNFRIFATNDLKIAANGESGTAITIDATNQDVTITNDLRVTAGQFYYGGTAVTATATELNYLDGVTGITLGTANELLIVGSDGTSIISDSTLSIDTGSNYIGINQSSPEVTLHMTGEGAQTAQIRMEQYNDSADAPDIRTRRYRGTIASPSAVQSGDYLFRSNHEYWNGSSLLVGGAFAFDNTNNANRTEYRIAVDTAGSGADVLNGWQFKIDGNDSGAITFNNAYKFPTADGSANQILQTDGSGTLSFVDNTGSGISDIVEDTTPQLGGDLDVNGQTITSASNGHIEITPNGTGNVGIGTSSPAYQVEIENTGANALLVLDRTDGASTFIEGGATDSVIGSVGSNDVKIAYNSVPVVTIGAGGAITTSGNVTAGNFTTAGQMQADLIRNREQRYTTSNMMKFNQLYTGAASGSYFSQNEYQKIVTIIPSGDSQNYQVSGRILCQTAGSIQTINFIAGLRSNTLPDLDWSIVYTDDHNGTAHFKPQLWTKETTTAGFIFAIQKISSGDLYGTVTVDLDVIPRASSQLDNVTVNTTQDSEQASVDAGYTANDMTLVRTISGTDVTFGGNVGIGNASPASPLTVAGVIESTTGGVKFPDGTTQTSAASGGVTEATAIEYAIALG